MFSEQKKAELESAITDYVVTKVPEFDLAQHADTSFSRLGLDSLGHVELTAALEKVLGVELEPDLAFNYPTVTALLEQLAQLQAEEA